MLALAVAVAVAVAFDVSVAVFVTGSSYDRLGACMKYLFCVIDPTSDGC